MLTRREALKGLLGTAAVAALQGGHAMADAPKTPARAAAPPLAYRGTHQVQPLPFDPAKLPGLSARLLTSHHDNNYAGAVKRLNLIQQQLGALPGDAPPYQVGALKREELIATNSMLLHELYFANLGGDGRPEGAVTAQLTAAYGSPAAWEQAFRQTGMALAGGSGWVILSYSPALRTVHTHWAGDHTQTLAGGVPLLVMDMYEHSYALDYGANAKGYIDAFFQNLDWAAVDRRTTRALAASA